MARGGQRFRRTPDRVLVGTRRLLLAHWAIIDGERIESLSGPRSQVEDIDARRVVPKGSSVVVDAAEFGLRYPAYWIVTEKGRFRAWAADLLRYSEPWTEKREERARNARRLAERGR